MIYLDYSATTPMSEEALNVYQTVAKSVTGNTMSLHDIGTEAERLLSLCRKQIASMLGVNEEGLFFTSGGTESNMLAILGLARAHRHNGHHIIAHPGEHASVLNTLTMLQKEGFEVTYLPLNHEGRITIDVLNNALTEETIMCVAGHINSEIGTVQDIQAIGEWCFDHHIIFHCDAVQSFGKHEINIERARISSLAVSSHKIYGPKGVGACFIHPDLSYDPVFPNGTHERGLRPGTINTPGTAAFTAAAEAALSHMEKEFNRIADLKNQLINKLDGVSNIIIESKNSASPYILGLRIKGMEGQYAMLECNRSGIAVATGSACKAGQQTPSKTLLAMCRSENEARELLRLSFGHGTTVEDIDRTVEVLLRIAK